MSDEVEFKNGNINGLAFRNELVNRLNNQVTRYRSEKTPGLEFFEVDEIYDTIDDILSGRPVDSDIELPEGIHVDLYVIKDGIRYNYKTLTLKELSLTLTESLMDGIAKMASM